LAATGADRWLRFFARGRGVILMFHHVRPWRPRLFAPNRLLKVTPEFLDGVLTELQQREGFDTIPFDAVPDRLRPGPRGQTFAALTFDVGNRNNVEHAWPVLRRRGAPWTLCPFAPNRVLEITPEFLDIVLTELRCEGFDVIPLDAVPERLRTGPAARPFAVLTFDDGYRDNVEHAWPVLRRHNAPWTLFVTTDFVDGRGRLWWLELEEAIARLDRVALPGNGELLDLPSRTTVEKQAAFEAVYRHLRARPKEQLRAMTAALAAQAGVDTRRLAVDLCLGWDELQALAREPDVSIGSHSLSHPILAKCDAVTAVREIAESRALLERRLGRPVRHMAYPFGDRSAIGAREFGIARQAGYITAVTSRPSHVFSDHAAHLHALPRVSINGLFQNERALQALLSGVPFWIWNRSRIATIEP
jgi:peptidoglycan/xylan/chitin deacetylase (PgdA/CDA1 family)